MAIALSDAATEHLGLLLQHRDDTAVITVEVFPDRCALCSEIASWSNAVASERSDKAITHEPPDARERLR